jgi:hypothetical protein
MYFQPVQEVIQAIRHAWSNGRQIVPLVGAGLSAEAGVPTTEGVIRYLAQLNGYVREQAYLPLPRAADQDPAKPMSLPGLRTLLEPYREPFLYVQDHGWPNYYHLYQNYGNWLRKTPLQRDLDDEVARQLDQLARNLYPNQVTQLLEVLPDPEPEPRRTFIPQVPSSILWGSLGRWPDLVLHFAGGDPGFAHGLFQRLQHEHRPGLSHQFLGFLTRMLGIRLVLSAAFDDLLEAAMRTEEIEHTVFALGEGRRWPSPELVRAAGTAVIRMHGDLSHIVGAQMYAPLDESAREAFNRCLPPDDHPLVLVMGISGRDRRVLDLVELVLERDEPPKDRSVPERDDPHKDLSVIWLHYEPSPPRSITQLLGSKRRGIEFARVTHFGLFLSHLYSALTSRHPSSHQPYLAHTQRPIGLEPRHAVPESVDPHNDAARRTSPLKGTVEKRAAPVRVYHRANCYLFTNLPRDKEYLSITAPNASERLAAFVNDLPAHIPLWIDLEGQYTLAGVIGAIVDQCRAYDPGLAPATLPLDEKHDHPEMVERGASRVLDALSRARYVLALDSLECYTWAHTVHHGDTRPRDDRESLREHLREFLRALIRRAERLQDSLICISVGPPKPRRPAASPTADERSNQENVCQAEKTLIEAIAADPARPASDLTKFIRGLPHRAYSDAERGVEPNYRLTPAPSDHGGAAPMTDLDRVLVDPARSGTARRHPAFTQWKSRGCAQLALLCLSCFRRTRNLVGLHTILLDLVQPRPAPEPREPYREVDEALAWFQRLDYLKPVAGGGFWMNRLLRDWIYSENSQFTTIEEINEHLRWLRQGNPLPAEQQQRLLQTTLQCLLLSFHHDRISRYYYFHNYIQSRDSFAFFEYVYHCVSSIRFLTQLVLLREIAGAKARDAWEGVRRWCVKALRPDSDERPFDRYFYLKEGEAVESLLEKGAQPDALQQRRKREIRGLRLAWKRSRDSLLRTVPAEQIISWCVWLIEDDLPRFLTREYAAKKVGVDPAVLAELGEPDPQDIRDEVRRLELDLFDLWAQSYRDRSDYEQCIELRLEQVIRATGKPRDTVQREYTKIRRGRPESLDHLLPPPPDFALEGSHPQEPLLACSWWLDIAECFSAQDQPAASEGGAQTERTLGLLDHLQTRLRDWSPGARGLGSELIGELEFRCRLLRIEHRLGMLDYWRRGYPFKDPNARREGGELYRECCEAMIDLREYDAAEGRAYFEYRTRFLIARARANALRSFPGSAGDSVPASVLDSYRDLELAHGGPREGRQLLHARASLFGAAFALIEARELLTTRAGLRDQDPRLDDHRLRPLLAQAEAKQALARGYLRRVAGELMAGPRNTVWWRFAFQVSAQYHSERVLLMLAELAGERAHGGKANRAPLESDPMTRRQLTQLLRRLRLGLIAIRRGIDRSPNRQGSEPTEVDLWLRQVWRELCFGSILFGYRIECDHRSRSGDRRLDPDLLAARWSLNQPVGRPAREPNESWWNDCEFLRLSNQPLGRSVGEREQLESLMEPVWKGLLYAWQWLNHSVGLSAGEPIDIQSWRPRGLTDPVGLSAGTPKDIQWWWLRGLTEMDKTVGEIRKKVPGKGARVASGFLNRFAVTEAAAALNDCPYPRPLLDSGPQQPRRGERDGKPPADADHQSSTFVSGR